MSTETAIPTVEEIRAAARSARATIESYPKCLDATIDDYPIGRSDRGKCRLQVERAQGKGYRTVRTTTDKFGRWCKPKKSTFRNDCTVVVTGLGWDHDVRWLGVGERSIYFTSANGTCEALAYAPHYCEPRREPRAYTVTSGLTRILDADGWHEEGEAVVEHHCLPADPPELCDAYDAWLDEYHLLRAIVEETWKGA